MTIISLCKMRVLISTKHGFFWVGIFISVCHERIMEFCPFPSQIIEIIISVPRLYKWLSNPATTPLLASFRAANWTVRRCLVLFWTASFRCNRRTLAAPRVSVSLILRFCALVSPAQQAPSTTKTESLEEAHLASTWSQCRTKRENKHGRSLKRKRIDFRTGSSAS